MKRYLISGAMALAFCSMFVGCSDDDEWMSYADAKVQAFDEAFTKIYGQIDPRQDWGFGVANQANYTREVNANANEWADPDKAYGGLLVPPPLTDEQIAVVKEYFQTVQYPDYEDPHWTNYFIQQVYKGGTDAKTGTNPATNKPYSLEKYMAADGNTYIVGSNNMDHLAAIRSDVVDHNYNFNHGDCSLNETVLDNGGNANDGPWHSDKITYMKESTTESFGYYNSNGSVRRTEYTGLVSFQTIINALGSKANCLNDGWNRSFMGFDFEQMVGDEIYAKVGYGDNPNAWAYYTYNGQQYHYLNSNMNMYCGDLKEFNDLNGVDIAGLLSQGYLPVSGSADKKWVKVGGCADGYYSDWIVTLTEAKRPGLQKGNVLLVKEEDGEYTGTVEYWRKGSVKSGRIFVEDLARADRGDIDFNDAVFDAYIYDVEVTKKMFKSDGSEIGTMSQGADKYTTIDMLACGGTLPLTVAGTEVHSLYGQSTTTMINTIGNNSVLNTSQGYQDHEVKTIAHAPYYESLAAIPVVVKYDKDVMVLNNYEDLGKVPHMICVPLGTPWPQERVAVGPEVGNSNTSDCAFPLFAQYVGNANIDPWGNYNEDKVYEWNITPETPSDIDERYIQKDTVYTGTIVSEYTVEVEQAIPTPTGTLVGSADKYPHQMKNGNWSTALVLSAQELQSAGVAVGKKLRIYGVGYNGEDISWQLLISGLTSDWINATNTPSLATKGYIEFDITDSNLNTFNSTVMIQGQAFNILAVTVVEASQQQGSGSGSGESGSGSGSGESGSGTGNGDSGSSIQLWPANGGTGEANNAQQIPTIAGSNFNDNMVGKTLKIYGKDFGQYSWSFSISIPNNNNPFAGLVVEGWNNWGSQINIALGSQNYNAADGTLSLYLTTELINLFKQGFNISQISNLTVTSIKVE